MIRSASRSPLPCRGLSRHASQAPPQCRPENSYLAAERLQIAELQGDPRSIAEIAIPHHLKIRSYRGRILGPLVGYQSRVILDCSQLDFTLSMHRVVNCAAECNPELRSCPRTGIKRPAPAVGVEARPAPRMIQSTCIWGRKRCRTGPSTPLPLNSLVVSDITEQDSIQVDRNGPRSFRDHIRFLIPSTSVRKR